jgi:hypothetical protein
MPVSFAEILDAFEFANVNAGSGEHQAIVCKQTGKIYLHSENSDREELNDEPLPEDIEDGEKYLMIPGKRDLDLGKPLALDFAREVLPDDFDEVRHLRQERRLSEFQSLAGAQKGA